MLTLFPSKEGPKSPPVIAINMSLEKFISGPNKKDTDDEDIKKLLKKMIKQRSESIEVYKKNNRQDLFEVEEREVQIISEYLPKQLSEEETTKVCKEIVEKIGAKSVKDMGKVMGELKKITQIQ